MTTRLSGFLVTLGEDVREDDAEAIIHAIRMVKGVISIKPVEGGYEQAIATERVRRELGEKIMGILYPKPKS